MGKPKDWEPWLVAVCFVSGNTRLSDTVQGLRRAFPEQRIAHLWPAYPARRNPGLRPALPEQRIAGLRPAYPERRNPGLRPAFPEQRIAGLRPAYPRATQSRPSAGIPRATHRRPTACIPRATQFRPSAGIPRANTVHVGLIYKFNPIHKGPKTPKLQCKFNTIQGVGIQTEWATIHGRLLL